MITVARTGCPAKLAKDGPAEIGDWRVYRGGGILTDKKGRPRKPSFKAYGSKEVREALNLMFHGKCAYCESKMDHITPTDVEHWRPKGNIATSQGLVDGYWWLGASWDNLFPACPFCNRPAKHKLAGGGETAGKGMRFPVNPERTQAPAEGDELTEDPLILNPSDPDPKRAPELHLEFATDTGKEGIIQAVDDGTGGDDDLGAQSIDVYGLNRDALVARRWNVDRDIRRAVRIIERATRRKNEAPPGSEAEADEQAQIDEQLDLVREHLENEAEYLLLARQLAQKYLPELLT